MIYLINLIKKNKLKTFLIFAVIFFLFFFSLWNVVSGGYDKQNKAIIFLKKFIPTKIARHVRDTVFIIPNLKERNRYLELIMRKYDQGLDGEIFNEEIVLSESKKNKYLLREFFIPFHRLDLRLGWASTKNATKKHYLDILEDNILVISGNGRSIYFDKNNIFNNKLKQKEIPNNIKNILEQENSELMGIRDLYIEDNKAYISLYFKNEKGYSMNIYCAEFNTKRLNFNLFFEAKEFWKDWTTRTGGRIEKYKDNEILLSLGDGAIKNSSQNTNSILGKIISINKISKKHKIVSLGHRNPQGLAYVEDLNLIMNTEHGPKGGDEININFLKSNAVPNYGWDISSYGTEYDGSDPYKKSHKDFGFVEPFKDYTPAIGISEILYIKDSSSNKKNIFVSSLRASSIYILEIDDKFKKIIKEDRLFFPEQRIRDMKYDKKNNIILLLFDPIPSIGVLRLEKK